MMIFLQSSHFPSSLLPRLLLPYIPCVTEWYSFVQLGLLMHIQKIYTKWAFPCNQHPDHKIHVVSILATVSSSYNLCPLNNTDWFLSVCMYMFIYFSLFYVYIFVCIYIKYINEILQCVLFLWCLTFVVTHAYEIHKHSCM